MANLCRFRCVELLLVGLVILELTSLLKVESREWGVGEEKLSLFVMSESSWRSCTSQLIGCGIKV